MANYVPKIEYTDIQTGTPVSFTFSHPPANDPFNERIITDARSTRSTNGTMQTQFNYNIERFQINYQFESLATKTAVEQMIVSHTSRGGTINYFPSSDEVDFFTVDVVDRQIGFARPAPEGADFTYDFRLTMERVL